MTINFDKFCLEIAKFESEAPKLLNLGYKIRLLETENNIVEYKGG